jgi:hypothetical protein
MCVTLPALYTALRNIMQWRVLRGEVACRAMTRFRLDSDSMQGAENTGPSTNSSNRITCRVTGQLTEGASGSNP